MENVMCVFNASYFLCSPTPLKKQTLVRTPLYYSQFSLSLGKAFPYTFSKY